MPPARPHYLCTTGCLNAAKLPAAPDRVCCERPEVCKTDSHVLHFLSRSSFYCSRGPGVSYPPTPPSHDSRSARQKTWWSRSELPLCFPRRNSAEKASGIVWHGTTSAFPNDLKWWNFFVGEGGGKKKKKEQPTNPRSLKLSTHKLPWFRASSYAGTVVEDTLRALSTSHAWQTVHGAVWMSSRVFCLYCIQLVWMFQHLTLKNFEYHVTGSWARDKLQDLLPFLNFMSSIVSYAHYQL